jgi:peroxiredoxin
MYKKYKPAGFTLIGVNVDKEAPPVKDLLARKPVSFPVLLDPTNAVSKAYHVDEMPSSVIIDRKGEYSLHASRLQARRRKRIPQIAFVNSSGNSHA